MRGREEEGAQRGERKGGLTGVELGLSQRAASGNHQAFPISALQRAHELGKRKRRELATRSLERPQRRARFKFSSRIHKGIGARKPGGAPRGSKWPLWIQGSPAARRARARSLVAARRRPRCLRKRPPPRTTIITCTTTSTWPLKWPATRPPITRWRPPRLPINRR